MKLELSFLLEIAPWSLRQEQRAYNTLSNSYHSTKIVGAVLTGSLLYRQKWNAKLIKNILNTPGVTAPTAMNSACLYLEVKSISVLKDYEKATTGADLCKYFHCCLPQMDANKHLSYTY